MERVIERERQREMERETERETDRDRKRDGKGERERDRQTEMERVKERESRKRQREMERERESRKKETRREIERDWERWIETERDRDGKRVTEKRRGDRGRAPMFLPSCCRNLLCESKNSEITKQQALRCLFLSLTDRPKFVSLHAKMARLFQVHLCAVCVLKYFVVLNFCWKKMAGSLTSNMLNEMTFGCEFQQTRVNSRLVARRVE